jgi:MFS family permease
MLPVKRSSIAPQVVLLGVASLLNDVSSDIIYPLLPIFLTTTLGATPAVLGLIEGTAEAVAAFLKYGAGALSDRFPRRKPFVVSGYALAAIARILVAIAAWWPTVLAGRLLDKAGKGIRSAPRDALIAEVTSPESRGRAFGFHRALDHTGAVIGPLIAALLLGVLHLPLRTIFLLAVIPGLAGVVLLLFSLREPARPARTTPGAEDATGSLPRSFWMAMIPIGFFYLANASDAFLILQASAAGVSIGWIPLLWAAHHVVKSLASTRAGALSDRMGRWFLLMLGWLVYAGIYLAFPFAGSLPLFLALFVLYALPFALTEGAERAWIADLVPEQLRGKSFGVYYMTAGLCTLTGTMAFGLIYQEVSARVAFHAAAGLSIVAAAIMFGQRKNARSRS